MARVEIRNLQQTVGVVSLLLFVSPSINSPLPSRLHDIPTNASTKLVSSDNTIALSWSYYDDSHQAAVLREFVLTLLANTRDLDKDLAEDFDKHFWDLYEPI